MAYNLSIKYEDLSIPASSVIPSGALQFIFDGTTNESKFENVHEAQLSATYQPDQNDDDTVRGWLGNLLSKPVVVSIVELKLTQAKKGKGPDTEQVNLIAQASIDLMDFIISGESERKTTAKLYLVTAPAAPSSHQGSAEDMASESEICFTLSVSQPLCCEKVLGKNWNIMEFRCLTGYVPEESLSKDDFMALSVLGGSSVVFNDKDSEVGAVGNKTYKLKWNKENAGIELEGPSEKTPSGPNSQNMIDQDPLFGDFTGSVGRKDQRELEAGLCKVTWASERRLLLTSNEINELETYIAKNKSLPVYLAAKVPEEATGAQKGKGKEVVPKSATSKVKSIGVANVNLMGLLYPGRTQVFASHRVSAVEEPESLNLDQFGLTNVNAGEVANIGSGYITTDVKMLRPVVKARDRTEVEADMTALIPERGAWPRIERGASHAVTYLKAELKKTAEFALEEIRTKLGNVSQIPMENREEAKRKLYYDLTISPEYQQYREQLKYAIIRIVREKYLKTTKFSSSREREEFLASLSIYLHEVLHETITEYFYVPTDTVDVRATSAKSDASTLAPSSGIQPSQILKFAEEAQRLGKNETAERWYQELCARDAGNADNWFSYAIFCLSLGDIDKAQECLCEAIGIDQNHHKSLICAPFVLAMTKYSFSENSGAKSTRNDFIREGQVFLERAQMNKEADQGLTWTLSALFHEYCMESGTTKNSSIMMEQAMMKVRKLETSQKGLDEFSSPDSLFLNAARFLIGCSLLTFAEKSLAHELQAKGNAVHLQSSTDLEITPADSIFIKAHTSPMRLAEYNTLLGKLHMFRGDEKMFDAAEQVFIEATTVYHRYTEAWAMLGHVYFITGKVGQAKDCYKRVLEDGSIDVKTEEYVSLVALRLGQIYLNEQQYGLAKDVFLYSCTNHTPTVHTWLGIGKACYYQGYYNEAEDALAEANMLDQRHPDVWAFLSAVCLQQIKRKPQVSRKEEAEQSYKYAIKMGCTDVDLLTELQRLQIQTGMGDPAF